LTLGPRTKRSILIAFYTAEELGLVGSRLNTIHEPAVQLDDIVANCNFDMVGHSGVEGAAQVGGVSDSNSVFIIGADKTSVELDRLNRKANEQTVQLNLDYTLSDPARGDRMFFRSDHASYMRHGIPVIWYYTGSDNSYHTPGDDIARIDFEKMARITQLGFATAWQVAQLDQRVSTDKTNWPALQ